MNKSVMVTVVKDPGSDSEDRDRHFHLDFNRGYVVHSPAEPREVVGLLTEDEVDSLIVDLEAAKERFHKT